jgi:excisionase family DNA binding protein
METGESVSHDPDRLLDIQEAAALLGVKVGTLYSWVSKGKVPFRKVGSLVRFHRGELMAWTVGQAGGGAAQAGRAKSRATKLRAVQ